MENKDTRTFKINPEIEMKKVQFMNRYGITLAGDLYLPENYENKKNPSVIVAGPFGAVKEQASGLYAQELAARGFVSIAFDPSFGGESGGEVRNTASPDIFTEDYSAAVDYIGLLPYVDRERIGAVGICGLSGMAVTAAGTDTRIKAVATFSMYDMSRDMSKGHMDYYTEEQRNKIKEYLSRQRWKDAENGTFALGNHEIAFDENNEPITGMMEIPEKLPEGADPAVAAFYNYYAVRARHPRAVNFVSSWMATMLVSFWNFKLMTNSKRYLPVRFCWLPEKMHIPVIIRKMPMPQLQKPKELVIVPDADHVALYDNMEKIPFDKLEQFFKENLK